MPILDETTRRLRMRHCNYWLHVYLTMVRRTTTPALKRAALARLRHFQRETKLLMAGKLA